MTRQDAKMAFVARAGWTGARLSPLGSDASMRSYDRLTYPDGHGAVLMDAPPDKGEDVRPFLHIARYLNSLGLSAPTILAEDIEQGFLLLEDLGDALFARVVRDQPDLEGLLYSAAAEALATLHQGTPPDGLGAYDPPEMTRLAGLAYEWYQHGITGGTPRNLADFAKAFEPMLASATGTPEVVILRDYHAENLLWLPERRGVARVGQLDFQDAMLGHRAYDLVSLLQDARRDVPQVLEEQMITDFTARSDLDPVEFRRAYDMLSLQRNLRILGVFARLSMAYGRVHYVELIPRVWAYLMRSLTRPGMEEIRERLLRDLPEPDAQALQTLRDKCAIHPLP